jgi:hypothetical protein
LESRPIVQKHQEKDVIKNRQVVTLRLLRKKADGFPNLWKRCARHVTQSTFYLQVYAVEKVEQGLGRMVVVAPAPFLIPSGARLADFCALGFLKKRYTHGHLIRF